MDGRRASKRRSSARGRLAERLAEHHLARKGYIISTKNYRTREGEIDIVATDDDCLVFVEVKSCDSFDPAQNVTPRKIERLSKAALAYITEFGYQGQARFDLVLISKGELRHVIDAFRL